MTPSDARPLTQAELDAHIQVLPTALSLHKQIN